MKLYCDPLADFVEIPEHPRRIVSLVSGLTEALVHMGHGDSIVGISKFCPRYVPELNVPIVGDYLKVDDACLRAVNPDLILISTGVQRVLAKKLHKQGLPVYVLPLPNSLHGIYDLIVLDEFTYPLQFGWIDPAEAIAWLQAHKPADLHLVITGRGAPPALIDYADLVSESREIKHPHRRGIKAQPGIEF